MRNLYQIILTITLIPMLFLTSCKSESAPTEPLTAAELYEKYKKSVALVYSSYHYEYKINDTLSVYAGSLHSYFVELYTNKQEAITASAKTFGTAFFIDDQGTMATNLHVVAPEITKDQQAIFASALEEYAVTYQEELTSVESEMAATHEFIAMNDGIESPSEIKLAKDRLADLSTHYTKLKQLVTVISAKPNFKNFKVVSNFVGVAYEQEQIAAPEQMEEQPELFQKFISQFHACNVVKMSTNGAIDLAIIRLKDGKTPAAVTNYFNFNDNNGNTVGTPDSFDIYKSVPINKQVFMIGYNHGLELAKTAIGIKPQITSGNISQESDGIKVMYTIASLQGSSGSPVIDEWGNLIAVNYAGILHTQGFNYGILSYHLKDLVQGTTGQNKFIKDDDALNKKRTVAPAIDEAAVVVDVAAVEVEEDPNYDVHSYLIRSFLDAESGRNLSNMLTYFANPVAQYWESMNVNHEQLSKKYENSWARSKWGKNEIKSITLHSANTYIVAIKYTFELNDGNTKEVNSKLYIAFDNSNKIKQLKSI